MAEIKTQKNTASVKKFIAAVEHSQRREDALTLLQIMTDITNEKPCMWGTSIIGFGSYHYKYASGREGDWMRIGFSPRKASMSLYIMNGFREYNELLGLLGKHKVGKSCLYINKLSDIDMAVLKQLIHHSFFSASMGEEK